MKYHLLLKGGRVVDAAAGLDGPMDVGTRGERIAEVAPDLETSEAERVIDARGLIVVPGLIDLHSHAFIGEGLGIETDETCRSTGVTTLVDGGSCGAATFKGFKELLIDRAETRLLAFLHISSIGLADHRVGESTYLNLHDSEHTAQTAAEYSKLIVGIKVRLQSEAVGDNGLEPLNLAKRAASLAGGLPTMVHVTHPPVPLSEIIDLLEPGDVVTHFLHGRGMGILDEEGRVSEPVKEARRRGIIFDVGHGRNHVNFPVARVALGEGFLPDTISCDLTKPGRAGVAKNLPHCLSKFLNLGMDLISVLACATTNPARILGREGEVGTLLKGAVADVAVFALESGDFTFEDCDKNTMQGHYRLSPRYTVREGNLTWTWK
jgi:dihydroorotase